MTKVDEVRASIRISGLAEPGGRHILTSTAKPRFDALVASVAATSDFTLDCVYVLDGQWRFCYLNQRAQAEVARGRDLLGQTIWDAFPGAREAFGVQYGQAMAQQVPICFEAHYPPLGGWYEIQATPMEEGILVSFRNINERKEAEQRLQIAEERYRLAALATNDLIYDWDFQAGHVRWSSPLEKRFGYATEHLGSTSEWWEARIHDDDRSRVIAEVKEVIEQQSDRLDCCYRWRQADGRYAEVHDRGYVMKDAYGSPIRIVGAMQDLTGERAGQEEALRTRNLLQTIIDSVTDHIYIKDSSGVFVLANRASQETWKLVGRRTADLLPAEVACTFDEFDREVMTSGEARTCEEVAPVNGVTRTFQSAKVPWRQDGEIKGVIGISRDITDQKLIEERVRWTATHDSLTSLPNRSLFQSRLTEMMSEAELSERELSLLLLDLDHFKEVNDTLGHDTGDALLEAFAKRLQASVRESDVVARLGGDEFAIILGGCGLTEADAVAQKLIASLRAPFLHEGRLLDCRSSIGASVFPAHGETPKELLKSADMALYSAKAAGRGAARLFEASIRDTLQKRVSMLSLGRDALRGQRIFPFYQPKINLRTGAVAGFEALLRWHHPRLGTRLPGTIAACFEDAELAVDISDRMIGCVIADMRDWLGRGLEFGSVAVNASAAEFRAGKFAEGILQQLKQANVPTRCFQLEVTETVFLGSGAECVERELKLLSSEGVQIALDDFGTGYASLSHLRQFPVDIIKIDRCFVRDMLSRPDDAAIARAIINLGQSLGKAIVAEGVETRAQEEQLRRMGCGYSQGFLYSEAFEGNRMAAYLGQDEDSELPRLSA